MTGVPAPEGAESITEAELAKVFANYCVGPSRNIVLMGEPGSVAAEVVAEALAHRESRHKPGAYEDSEGNLYFRVAGLNAWLRVMDDGVTEVRPDDWVERPLRKLVPLPSHDELVAVLVESITHDVHGYEGQAQRVLTLMEGGSDD